MWANFLLCFLVREYYVFDVQTGNGVGNWVVKEPQI